LARVKVPIMPSMLVMSLVDLWSFRDDRCLCVCVSVCPEREGESDVGGLFGAMLHGR